MCDFEAVEETVMIVHVREKHEQKLLSVNFPVSEESSSEDEESNGSSAAAVTPRKTSYLSS